MVTIKFGLANSFVAEDGKYDDVSDILNDSALASLLGFGDNVVAFVDGSEVDADFDLNDGDIVSLQTKAHGKSL